MDKQGNAEAVQRRAEAAWPKKRTLIVGARTVADFIRAGQIAKRFEEDVIREKQQPGRYHGITYTAAEDRFNTDPVYCWYSATQITIHFGD